MKEKEASLTTGINERHVILSALILMSINVGTSFKDTCVGIFSAFTSLLSQKCAYRVGPDEP